jgi:hypothetical protein
MSAIKLLALVAVLHDMPEELLVRGDVGTVVEELSPTAVLVEFVNLDGSTRVLVAVKNEDLLVLHLNPVPQVA